MTYMCRLDVEIEADSKEEAKRKFIAYLENVQIHLSEVVVEERIE